MPMLESDVPPLHMRTMSEAPLRLSGARLITGIFISLLAACAPLGHPSPLKDQQSDSSAPRGALAWQRGETSVQLFPPPALILNKEVRHELDFLLKGRGSFVRGALERRAEFEPVLREIFEDHGLHPDLLNLALIESGFRLDARSYAGAVGPWQFMKQTGRMYGLRAERDIDQRTDLVLSTIAAARHLKDLYVEFRDWNLVLAAYNAGPAAVERAMSKGRSNDFWVLARQKHFRTQTIRYVPRFIAACLIVRRAEELAQQKSLASHEVVRDFSVEDFNVAHLQRSENWPGSRYPSLG